MQNLPLSAELQSWFEKGKIQNFNNEQHIFVIDEGREDQTPIVLVHGFPTSTYDFAKIWPSLGADYRRIALDMLGFGFSDKPNQRSYTIHKQADLFDQLIKEKNIKEFHLFAHDYGNSVAQELLARQKDGSGSGTCLSCCFLNGGLFPETHQALLIQKIMLSPLGKYVNSLVGFNMFKKSFNKVFGHDTKASEAELQQFWELINYNDGRHVFHNLITYMRDRKIHRERWLTPLQQSEIPMALINGSVDPVSGAHLVARYKELHCRLDYLKELPDIGHYPQVEAADQVSNAYLEFLRSNQE